MFERNEKYGHALHLQYGAQTTHDSGAGAPNQHFGVVSFIKDIFTRDHNRDFQDSVEVEVADSRSLKTEASDQANADFAANENSADAQRGRMMN
ncbi:MAG: hypothetical protein NXI13_15565 [Proteobacteria bacterium]|nr:hypothetical protein [Pseudomonadota bacterium]